MLIAFLISLIARIFMPQSVVLVNQKLHGYWLVTEETRIAIPEGKIRITRFDKCKKAAREAKECTVSFMHVDSSAIHKNKLSKEIKNNWEPIVVNNFWVERKRDKETKLAVIHFEQTHKILIELLKKEITVYLDSQLVYQAKKLR